MSCGWYFNLQPQQVSVLWMTFLYPFSSSFVLIISCFLPQPSFIHRCVVRGLLRVCFFKKPEWERKWACWQEGSSNKGEAALRGQGKSLVDQCPFGGMRKWAWDRRQGDEPGARERDRVAEDVDVHKLSYRIGNIRRFFYIYIYIFNICIYLYMSIYIYIYI